MSLPRDPKARKRIPVYSGFVTYFPDAIAAVAELSLIGNDQHSPGEPLHWNKEKSKDEMDSMMRHTVGQAKDPVARDADGVLEATKTAWRSLANLQRLADSGVDVLAISRDETSQSARDAVFEASREMYQKADNEMREGMRQRGLIADGFGSVWDIICPMCLKPDMQVVRPGKARCANCG